MVQLVRNTPNGLKWAKWTEVDLNEPNGTEID